jgi:SAM-dependent methyltransferase
MNRLKEIVKPIWYTLFRESPQACVSRYVKGIALEALQRKARSVRGYREWLEGGITERVRGHWGHSSISDEYALEHLKSQIYEITAMLKRRVEGAAFNGYVLDAGASDGLFLSLLGFRSGIGLNILMDCAKRIRKDGFTACRADLESLPFRSKSFDYVICCETLEHLQNPIRGLQELERICRRKLFLTIPWLPLSTTRINERRGDNPDNWHVFEFCHEDFKKIVSYTNFKIAHHEHIEVLPQRFGPFERMLLRKYLYLNFFPKLQYYELVT